MTGSLQLLLALTGIAALVVVFVVLVYGITWLVGVGFRYAPLVGHRHRTK